MIKVGMIGDPQIGKTSLMRVSLSSSSLPFPSRRPLKCHVADIGYTGRVKYVEGSFDEDYIQTLGEAFLSVRRPQWRRSRGSRSP